MTIEEAIRILDPETTGQALAEIEYYNGFSGKKAAVHAVSDACILAVAALREQEERDNRLESDAVKNEPLTLDELRKMAQRCEGVYVAHVDGSPVFRGKRYCAAVLDFSPAFGSNTLHVHAIYGDRLTLWEDDYRKTWIAYRSKPKEDEK